MNAKTLRTPDDLLSAGLIEPSHAESIGLVAASYSVAIPAYVRDLIGLADPNDPIALQYVPDIRELNATPGEDSDPIGDTKHTPVTGIVHRYEDRVLLKVVHACPVYCRFCFRRAMVGPGHEPNLSPDQISTAVVYIQSHPEIREVILTGGDPLILAPHRIAELTKAISAISHIERIRWHTRVPVVDPAKVTAQLTQALKSPTARTIIAVHANHPREFTSKASAAIATLRAGGVSLISQSVLLKGINDNVDTIVSLIEAFRAHQIKPYYIHHADLAPGTLHFRTTIAQGQEIMRQAWRHLPEDAVPTYVLDIPGGFSKVNLLTDNAKEIALGHWQLRDAKGLWHTYHEDRSLLRKDL